MAEVNILSDLIKTGEGLRDCGASISDPRFTAWKMNVERYLTDRFGSASVEVKAFQGIPLEDWYYTFNVDAESPIAQYLSILQNCRAEAVGMDDDVAFPYYTASRHEKADSQDV